MHSDVVSKVVLCAVRIIASFAGYALLSWRFGFALAAFSGFCCSLILYTSYFDKGIKRCKEILPKRQFLALIACVNVFTVIVAVAIRFMFKR